MVVALVDEEHVDRSIPQRLGALQAAEAAADHDDARTLLHARMMPDSPKLMPACTSPMIGEPRFLEPAAQRLARRQPGDLVDHDDVADALVARELLGDRVPAAPRR